MAHALREKVIYFHFPAKEPDTQNLKPLTHGYTVEPCSRIQKTSSGFHSLNPVGKMNGENMVHHWLLSRYNMALPLIQSSAMQVQLVHRRSHCFSSLLWVVTYTDPEDTDLKMNARGFFRRQ